MDTEPTFTDPTARRLGEALYERRKRLGLTQVDLAEKARVPQSTISRVESGEAIPSLATLNRLRAALGMTDGEYLLLIGGSGVTFDLRQTIREAMDASDSPDPHDIAAEVAGSIPSRSLRGVVAQLLPQQVRIMTHEARGTAPVPLRQRGSVAEFCWHGGASTCTRTRRYVDAVPPAAGLRGRRPGRGSDVAAPPTAPLPTSARVLVPPRGAAPDPHREPVRPPI